MKKQTLKTKIRGGTILLLVLTLALFGTGVYSVLCYRQTVRDVSIRAKELPAANRLSTELSSLQMQVSQLQGKRQTEKIVQSRLNSDEGIHFLKRFELFDFSQRNDLTFYSMFYAQVQKYQEALFVYRQLIEQQEKDYPDTPRTAEFSPLLNDRNVRTPALIKSIESELSELERKIRNTRWTVDDSEIEKVKSQLDELQRLTDQLPLQLHAQLTGFSDQIRSKYRFLLWTEILTGLTAAVLLTLLFRLTYLWIFFPLNVLLAGSRKVASGRFGERIYLETNDEMSELATAFNQMTEQFETIRDGLDEQVKKRTEEVVLNERLASVGFLAAGVAHEINNPLASIAMSAESLERRWGALLGSFKQISDSYADHSGAEKFKTDKFNADFFDSEKCLETENNLGSKNNLDSKNSLQSFLIDSEPDFQVIEKYLKMIQDEAFRCKGITEKLLDFARTGNAEKVSSNLTEIVKSIVEMTLAQSRYKRRKIIVDSPTEIWGRVNPQEFKQVVLNLLINALDSTSPENGQVTLELLQKSKQAVLRVIDNGSGMTPEVLENVFEPFYSKRPQGQGTGLGLSITHRIVADHQGRIFAFSSGPGQGAIFTVELPQSEQ